MVSESQFSQVLNIELDQIIEACKFLDGKWCPKFLLIIAQKNHFVRKSQKLPNPRDENGKITNILDPNVEKQTFGRKLQKLPNPRDENGILLKGIEMLSLGSFKTGTIMLSGLFVYDIFWVFFTPVMVSVAKSFDAPIKLLFPSRIAACPFSMLGLGDIVIPALALRYDVSRGKESHYFKSAFLGYTVGLVCTIVVMNWF
ncbi:putative Piwi domain, presenilin/signal peptide peptidase, plant signal peptide peptidase [Helianthus anomalus]